MADANEMSPAEAATESHVNATPVQNRLDRLVQLPEHFGRYRILQQLGQGGMGAVYLAEDSQLGRQVAIKVPNFGRDSDPIHLERFIREARVAATLDHPNICSVFDVGNFGGVHFISMAFIDGVPLSSMIAKDRSLDERKAATAARKLALALEEAHRKGFIHRDIKPSNVMVNRRGEPILMDFGLARLIEQADVRLTNSGQVVGTPAYMAPEQVTGDLFAIGPRTDVYSLGVVLFELLTGRLPFQGSVGAILAKILVDPQPVPLEFRVDLSPDIDRICRKAMARAIDERYRSMAAFAADLTEFLRAKTHKVPTNPFPSPSGVSATALLTAENESVAISDDGKGQGESSNPISSNWKRHGIIGIATVAVVLLLALKWKGNDRSKLDADRQGELTQEIDDVPAAVVPKKVADAGAPTPQEGSSAPTPAIVRESHFDRLDRKQISRYELRIASVGGADLAPKELVAIFGDSRLHHWGEVVDAVHLAGENTIASVGEDRSIRFWDAKSGEQVWLALGHNDDTHAIACDVKRGRLATVGANGRACLWNESTRAQIRKLDRAEGPLMFAAFAADGKWLTAANVQGSIFVWETSSGKLFRTVLAGKSQRTVFAVRPNGGEFLAGDGDGVQRIDMQTNTALFGTALPRGRSTAAVYSKDGNQLAVSLATGEVRVFDIAGKRSPRPVVVNAKGITQLLFTDDGESLLIVSDDRRLRSFVVADGRLRWEFPQLSNFIRKVSLSPDGKTVVLAGPQVRLLRTSDGKEIPLRADLAVGANAVRITDDSQLIVASYWDETLRTWSVEKRRIEGQPHEWAGAELYAMDRSQSNALLGAWNAIRYRSVHPSFGGVRFDLTGQGAMVAAMSKDSRQIATGDSVGQLRVYDGLRTPPRLLAETTVANGPITALAMSPDSTVLFTGASDGQVHLRDAATAKSDAELALHRGTVRTIQVSPNSPIVASGGFDKAVRVWDFQKRQRLFELTGHTDEISCVAFRSDGNELASSSMDGSVRIWDMKSGKAVRTIQLGMDRFRVCGITYAPDGRHLVTANSNGTLYVLRLADK